MRISLGRKFFTIISGIVLAVVIFIGVPATSMAYQPTVGIVSAAAAKVRKEPNTSSDVVGSLLKGSSVTITDEVTDSSGSVWYKVTVESNTGYIRSDLLIKATVSTPNTQTQSVNLSTNASKPAATAVTQIAETKAYVNYKSVVVRQGASTDHEIMGSVAENTPVIITGEAKASNGKKWYQIRYTNQSGREAVGFVRSDLLTVGDPPAAPAATEAPAETPAETPADQAPAEGEGTEAPEGTEAAPAEGTEETPTEAPVEEPVPAEPEVKPDYEMVFTQNDEGVEEWFLYDNINGTRQALSNLQAAAAAGANMGEVDSEQLSTQKIIMIVLGVAVAILAITVVLLLFKIKDLYSDDEYEDDDEDDEDDDEDEDEDEDDEDDDEDDEEEEVEKKRSKKRTMADSLKAVNNAGSVKVAKEKEKSSITIKNVEYIPEEEPFEPGKAVVSKPQSRRKAKNFLIDDDEFEFEFLNMDDRN